MVSPSGSCLDAAIYLWAQPYWSSPTTAVSQKHILLTSSSIQELLAGSWMFLALPADFSPSQ
uniref:Uncharacterized protein n=1 Tax=Arundo donax TaxID=35708 RepID=A0A0A8ZTQ6_ARUDO